MKVLISTLILCSALSVLAGGATAKQVEDLRCDQSKCAFDEELGPSQTKTFKGYCGAYQATPINSNMICHAVKGMTCTKVEFNDMKDYWSCMCTNWKTKEQHTTIDVYCTQSK